MTIGKEAGHSLVSHKVFDLKQILPNNDHFFLGAENITAASGNGAASANRNKHKANDPSSFHSEVA
jgi:hypothetical protein